MTTSVCPPGVTELQSCICSTAYNHNIVETRISNSVYGCNSTATGEQASARTVYETYCGRRADREEEKPNAGVIAGAVMGSVLGLAMVVAGVFFHIRRRRDARGQPEDGVHPQLTDDEDDGAYPGVYGSAAAIVPTMGSTSSISKSIGPARINHASPASDCTNAHSATGPVHKQNSSAPPAQPAALLQPPPQRGQVDQQVLTLRDVDSSALQPHTATSEERSVLQSHQSSIQPEVTRQVHSESRMQGTTTRTQSHGFHFDLADQNSLAPQALPKVQSQDVFHSNHASQPSSPPVALSSSPPTRQFLPRLEMQGHQPLVDWSESSYYSASSQRVSRSGLLSEHSSYTVTNAHAPPPAGESGSRSFPTLQQRPICRSGSTDGFREMD